MVGASMTDSQNPQVLQQQPPPQQVQMNTMQPQVDLSGGAISPTQNTIPMPQIQNSPGTGQQYDPQIQNFLPPPQTPLQITRPDGQIQNPQTLVSQPQIQPPNLQLSPSPPASQPLPGQSIDPNQQILAGDVFKNAFQGALEDATKYKIKNLVTRLNRNRAYNQAASAGYGGPVVTAPSGYYNSNPVATAAYGNYNSNPLSTVSYGGNYSNTPAASAAYSNYSNTPVTPAPYGNYNSIPLSSASYGSFSNNPASSVAYGGNHMCHGYNQSSYPIMPKNCNPQTSMIHYNVLKHKRHCVPCNHFHPHPNPNHHQLDFMDHDHNDLFHHDHNNLMYRDHNDLLHHDHNDLIHNNLLNHTHMHDENILPFYPFGFSL